VTALQNRIRRLQERQTDRDNQRVILKSTARSFTGRTQDDALAYISQASAPVPQTYTQNTYSEAERVRNQLEQGLQREGLGVEFEYQGSVTSDTHIRFYSDIDLLTLTTKFTFVKPPLQPTSPYQGNATQDLYDLRLKSVGVLRNAFPAATVDDSGPMCIAISGGSLRRKIEVVPASWLNTAEWNQSGQKMWRGLHVLDAKRFITIANMPFLHNARIDERDVTTRGRFRGLVRLAKSIKYDAEPQVEASSYDLTGLCYALPTSQYASSNGIDDPASLLELVKFANVLIQDPSRRQALRVPNGTRALFGPDGMDVSDLAHWCREAVDLLNDVYAVGHRSGVLHG